MSNRDRLRWTLLVLAALALDIATIILFHRTGHSRRVQWMSIGTSVILFVGVPAVILTLVFGRSLRARPQRRWGQVALALLLLASGAVALGYRYRLEHQNGTAILQTVSLFAIVAGADLARSVINRRTSLALVAFGVFSIVATTTALVLAWTWNPCRYQRCVDVGTDSAFGAWTALAGALAIASAWTAYYSAMGERRARWGLRFAGLVLTMSLGAFGIMAEASHLDYGGFRCGPPPLPYDAPRPPPSPVSFC